MKRWTLQSARKHYLKSTPKCTNCKFVDDEGTLRCLVKEDYCINLGGALNCEYFTLKDELLSNEDINKECGCMECKHENPAIISMDYEKKECVVKCMDCGHILKLTGCYMKSIECVPDVIPKLDIPVAYHSNEDFDGGYVDFEGDIAP